MVWPDAIYGCLREQARGFRHVDRSPADRALRELLPSILRPGVQVLDVGCGTGVMACHLAASGAESVVYLGIDPDPEACAVARRVLVGLPQDRVRGEVEVMGVEDYLRHPGRSADLVIAARSLHECLDPQDPGSLSSLAARLAALVAPGGRLLVCEPVTAPEASAEESARIEAYGGSIAGEGGKPHVAAALIHEAFAATGLDIAWQRDGERLILGRHLGLARARYDLLLLARP